MRWTSLACITIAIPAVASTALAQGSVEQFYRGKTDQHHCRRRCRRRLRQLRPRARPPHEQIHSRQPVDRAAEHAGRGQQQGGRLRLLGRAQGRHRHRRRSFPAAILAPLLGDTPIQHDPAKFIYVGSANSDVYTCVVRSDTPIKSFKDAFTQEVIVGASNEGGTTRDMPTLSNNVLGTKFRIVTGYAGTREITLAVERKRDARALRLRLHQPALGAPRWIADKFVRIIVQENAKGTAELNKQGVPRTVDFAKTPEDRQVMELVYSQAVIGRPFVLPEGVPAERVAALRKAFMAAFADPALLAEADKMKVDVEPIAGDEVQTMVAQLFAMPARIVERAKQALIYKPPSR